jgi:serine/threonine protein phosphatase 1
MNIFRAEDRKSTGRSWRGTPQKRCYAIGDIHGRLDLLEVLLEKIARDMDARAPRESIVVAPGDLIDKGPGSRCVVALLSQPLPFRTRLICL